MILRKVSTSKSSQLTANWVYVVEIWCRIVGRRKFIVGRHRVDTFGSARHDLCFHLLPCLLFIFDSNIFSIPKCTKLYQKEIINFKFADACEFIPLYFECCTYMVINLKTSRLMDAATTASPNKMNTRDRATYPGLLVNALSFCSAT